MQNLNHYKKGSLKAVLICTSNVKSPQKTSGVDILPWQKALGAIGL